jgi:hypothetical protein
MSEPITIEEKGVLIQLMHNTKMRVLISEIFDEIKSPKKVDSAECLKIIADILKFVLTRNIQYILIII